MKYLSLLVFSAGAVTLGVELSAARLLDPWFGNSQIVWAGLIGLILLYLSLGAWLGGKLADRFPSLDALLILTTIAALGVALIPAVSPPILRLAAQGLASFAPGLLVGTLVAVLLLFSFPVVLLGAVTPWAVRLAVTDLRHTGATAGRLSAVATAGSIIGTFLPVLWLIPTFGTRWSFYLLALMLLVVAAAGFLTARTRRRWLALPATGLVLVLALALTTDPASVRGDFDDGLGEVIYEDETLYNYISVRRWGDEHHLKLNEGVGIHSVYHPDMLLSRGIWDYFLLAPLFRNERPLPDPTDDVLIIGLAGGTVSELYTDIYGPLPITGVELDPAILEAGRRYFNMNQPNLTAIAADGRRWLQQQPPDRRFDFILVDAYRPPYIPFHLATVEFFDLVRSHLAEDGVVAINVGRTDRDYALVEAMTATLRQVFPSVIVVDEPGPPRQLANSLVVATAQPTNVDTFARNVATLPDTLAADFRQFAAESVARARVGTSFPDILTFTDDHAPVEQVVHGIIWDFLTASE
ncbi:spermine synthase [bacterium]|nr:spermine synthase [bacterium]